MKLPKINAPKMKLDMKSSVSQREFILLVLLIVFVEIYLFAQVLTPKWTEYTSEKQMNDTRQEQMEKLKADYDRMGEYQITLTAAQNNEDEIKKMIPPYMNQEELIILLDDVAAQAKLQVNVMTFQSVETLALNSYEASSTDKNAAEPAASESTNQSDTAAAATDTKTQQSTGSSWFVANQKVSVNFTGEYNDIHQFLNLLEQNNRKTYSVGLSLANDDTEKMSGTLNLSFLSYVDKTSTEQYKMDLNSVTGKSTPFTPYKGYVNGEGKAAAVTAAQAVSPDFILYLNSYLDNASKIIMSDYSDANARINIDQNGELTGNLKLTAVSGGYSYSFTFGGKTVKSPHTIKTKNGKIVVEIVAQPRTDAKDLVGATLDIDNKSGVPVQIVVSKDDSTSPRFKLGKVNGTVKMG